jgi:hypothetical protein
VSSTITTFAGLLSEIQRLIDGDDTPSNDIPSATLTRIVRLGEARIYREAETRFNEATSTLTTASNLAAMPADFQKVIMIYGGDGKPLDAVPEDALRVFNTVNTSILFGPPTGDGTTFTLRYYAVLPALTDSTIATNPLFQAADDLFVYGALSMAAPYFGQLDKVQLWEAEYQRILTRVNRIADEKGYTTIGPVHVRYGGFVA